jgi:16S rRNA G966 N2-methylase RsmD
VTFVERAPTALKVLRGNLEKLGLREGFRIQAGSVGEFLRRARAKAEQQFGIVFLDPPYDAAGEYATVLALLGGAAEHVLDDGALIVAEHRRKEKLDVRYGKLERMRLLEQGDAALSFYQIAGDESGK